MRPLSPISTFLLISAAGAFSLVALPPQRQRAIPSGSASRSPCAVFLPLAPRGSPAVGRPSDNAWQSRDASRGDRSSFRATGRLAMSASPASSTTVARQYTQKKRIAFLMSFMTGWCDHLLLTKYGYLATMHTGNVIRAFVASTSGRTVDVIFFLTAISSYMLGSATFRSVELSFKEKALNGMLAPVVLGCMVWADYLMWVNPSRRFVPAMLLSFSWGIINAVGSEVTGVLVWVIVVAMIHGTNMMVDRIHPASGRKTIDKEGAVMSLSVIIGLTLGIAWSVFLSKTAPQLLSRGTFSIMGAIYGLLFLWVDRKELGAWWASKGGEPGMQLVVNNGTNI